MVVIGVVVSVIALGEGDETTTVAPSGREVVVGACTRSQGERADLISFQLDDRSQAGITDIWVAWTIKNSSSEKSDCSWDWEAIDANGTRLENGTQLET
ncbi:hypothetical protein ACWCQQ_06775 [Streptomyces sp. NPDC002143]